jgi:hypothetical protein
MNVSAEQLEFVVGEVIRRLSIASSASSNSAADALSLQVGGNVLTLASLDGRLDGVQRVVVGHKTVVTPAAIDALKERSIALVRADSTFDRRASEVVLVKHENVESAAVEEFLRQLPTKVRSINLTDCEQLGTQVRPGEAAILLTNRPYEAACHANRDTRVCAVYPHDPGHLILAMNEVTANVLVVNANKYDRSMISTFLIADTKR